MIKKSTEMKFTLNLLKSWQKNLYFFDVNQLDQAITILPLLKAKKKFDQEGNFHFEKHKVFLYKGF